MEERFKSLLESKLLTIDLPGVSNFELSDLGVSTINKASIENLRLGKQIERWVSLAINESAKFELLYENIQVFDGKITIGEFDFIFKNNTTNQIHHLELVYKFYLYKPVVNTTEINKWIGPNLKDSLSKKIDRLKIKQFPLLFKPQTKLALPTINVNKAEQNLCFMAHLFVPYSKEKILYKDISNEAIIGYWYPKVDFLNKFKKDFLFHLPTKTNWGLNPSTNSNWFNFDSIVNQIEESHARAFSPLCWVKSDKGEFSQCFIVWW